MSSTEIRYLIIDDDLVSAMLLRKYLQSYEHLNFIGIVENTQRAKEIIESQSVDLIFLDIEMPGDDGLEFLRTCEMDLMVIFVTSKSKYALSAFDFNPIHFLTKPLDKEKLGEAIRRVFAKVKSQSNQATERAFLILKDKSPQVKIPFSEMMFVEAAADYMLVHTVGKSYIFHITMKELSAMLPAHMFVRVHRSYLVNKHFVTTIEKEFVLLNGKKIPVGPKYRDELKYIFHV